MVACTENEESVDSSMVKTSGEAKILIEIARRNTFVGRLSLGAPAGVLRLLRPTSWRRSHMQLNRSITTSLLSRRLSFDSGTVIARVQHGDGHCRDGGTHGRRG